MKKALLEEREHRGNRDTLTQERKKLKQALEEIGRLERLVDIRGALKGAQVEAIVPVPSRGKTTATAIAVASDWHVGELVKPELVGGRNAYNLSIAKQRGNEFFVKLVKLIKKEQQDVEINTLVLALLGDFITNNEMHYNENAENMLLDPTHETLYAFELIASGIAYILANTKVRLVIPCHSGNHGRTTEFVRVASEQGHSYEYLMYVMLNERFRSEKRIQFIISEGYHSYVELYGYTIRFHHGHNIRYGGGVGGITIPVNKAIAQWNRLRVADCDVFGHFHQLFDGGNFTANGSMIGYNAYALSIKAAYEPPRQMFFLVDSKRGKTITAPIYFNDRPK